MTIEALALTICLASSVFGRGKMAETECKAMAENVTMAAKIADVSPVLILAVNIQECDLRERVDAPIWKGEGKKRKMVGVDACPMGVRILGITDSTKLVVERLYNLAGEKMSVMKKWCERNHKGAHHHFISHYNQGNPTYAAQILGFMAVLQGRPVPDESSLTARSKEIIRRLLRVFRQREA